VQPQPLGRLLSADETNGLVFGAVVLLVLFEWFKRGHVHPLVFDRWPKPVRWLAYSTFIWLILYLGTYGSGTFIYFQF
jgi:hypothetical protein